MSKLILLFGPATCADFPLEKDKMVVGRSTKTDFAFPKDDALSRNHFTLCSTSDGWSIEDKGSKNGTHVNGMKIDRAVLLQGPFYGECNEEVVTAVRRYPDRFLGAAYVDPWGQSRDTILALLDRPEFCAAKMECSVATGLCGLHPEADLSDSKLTWLWKPKLSLSFASPSCSRT